MSGTDKTRPLRVQMWDPESKIEKVAVHDHRFSGCDLPETLEEHEAQMGGFFGDGKCRWRARYNGVGCGCSTCHTHEPESPSKSERREVRNRVHDWVRLSNSQTGVREEDFE